MPQVCVAQAIVELGTIVEARAREFAIQVHRARREPIRAERERNAEPVRFEHIERVAVEREIASRRPAQDPPVSVRPRG